MKKILPANRSFALKSLLALAVTAAGANSAMAADGTINFTGEITAASCNLTGGPGTTVGGSAGNQTIGVPLGKVSIDSLGGTAGGGIAASKNINLSLDCGNTATGLSTVKLQFDPRGGSGIDSRNVSLLKTSGVAQGVGIGLYDNNNALLNLSANDVVSAPLTDDGTGQYTAELNLRAGYVANGATITVGSANGTLPFSLSYE